MSSEPLDASHSDGPAEPTSCAGRWIVFLFQPKFAIPLIVILLLVMAPLIFRAIRVARVPPADEPFDTKSVLAFVVPDMDNAYVEYRAASALHVEFTGKPDELEKAQSDGWKHATEPVRKWLDANRPFMELWRKGSAKSDAQYFRAGEVRIDTLLPAVQEAREFSRLVRLESSRLLAEGKTAESWDWLRSSFRMSRQLGRHGPVIERLVGIATHSITYQGMVNWASDPQVTADLLRRAMRELQDEQKRTAPLSACLKHEYLATTATMASLPAGPMESASFFLTGELEIGERSIRHVVANWLAQADKPRLQRTKQDLSSGLFEPEPKILKPRPSVREVHGYVQTSVFAALFHPVGQQLFTATDREAARDRVLLTVLALELFAREHGHYPEKLEELIPDFLPAVPEDTHALPMSPLRYRRDADGALIYSVGDNGVDDGGLFEKVEDIGYRIGKPRENAPE